MNHQNKLVRDKIPEIVAANNEEAVTRTLSDEDYFDCLKKKLIEEVAEYLDGNNTEELADILEVVYALAKAKGVGSRELDQKRAKKAESNGAFDKKVFLVSTR